MAATAKGLGLTPIFQLEDGTYATATLLKGADGGAVTIDAGDIEIDTGAMEALLTTIDADTSIIAGAIAGTEVQVDVLTSALPTGASTAANQTTIIGHLDGVEGLLTTIDADTGGILTAVQLIDNAVDGNYLNTNLNYAGTDAATGGGVEAGSLRVTIASDSTGLVSVDDNSGSLTVDNTSIDGPGKPVIDSYTHASINLNAGNDQVLVSSAANKQIWVYGFGFTVNAAGTVSFQDEDNTAITGIMNIAANSGMAISPSGNFAQPIWKLATDKDLEVDVVTSELDGWIDYAIVSV